MNENPIPNYQSYSVDELVEVLEAIDSKAYPERAKAAKIALKAKLASDTFNNDYRAQPSHKPASTESKWYDGMISDDDHMSPEETLRNLIIWAVGALTTWSFYSLYNALMYGTVFVPTLGEFYYKDETFAFATLITIAALTIFFVGRYLYRIRHKLW